jgi:hypothetical protein
MASEKYGSFSNDIETKFAQSITDLEKKTYAMMKI